MFAFDKSWTDEIAEVSTLPEFQTATVRVFDPSLVVTNYDIATDTYTEDSSVADIYVGQARIISVRDSVNRENNDTGYSSAITSIRVQLPKNAADRVNRGCRMVVTASADNPVTTTYLFRVVSDFQGSNVASRTLEFAVDGDYFVQ